MLSELPATCRDDHASFDLSVGVIDVPALQGTTGKPGPLPERLCAAGTGSRLRRAMRDLPVALLDADFTAFLLDHLDVAMCLYDAADRVVTWNESYLDFFPEQRAHLAVGVDYADTLRRFFASNLPEAELSRLDEHVRAGVERHRAQQVPFVFQRRNGRWFKVASLPAPGGGRVRMWRDVTAEQGGEAPTTARAVAALDVAYAVYESDGRFLTANKRYQELFPGVGHLVGEAGGYGEHLAVIGAILDDKGQQALRLMAGRGPSQEPLSLPVLFRRADGGWLQLEERAGEDGTRICLWTDATRQAEAEARILRLESYLEEALQTIPQGLLLFDRDGRLALCNRQVCEIEPALAARMTLGAPLDRLLDWYRDANLAEATSPADAPLDRLRAGDEVRTADGRWLRLQACRSTSGDLLVLVDDVTAAKTAETELQRQRDAMHQSEKLAAMGSLLAGVAHELNNPLSVVVGRTALLLQGTVDPVVATQARTIAAAAERCARIVRTFLEIARQRPPARRAVAPASLIADVMALLDYGLRAAGIEVEVTIEPSLPELWADPDQLAQVLINLVVNAQQALAGRDEPRRLGVRARYIGALGEVELAVADNGPGVAAELRGRVFDPYFTTKPAGEGTGLGLAMSLNHVRAHDGRLSIETSPGRGATFVVRLPVVPAPAEAAPTPAAEFRGTAGGSRRVLVVDDEPEIADLLEDILSADGNQIVVEPDGDAALARLVAEPFDLVVSDLTMPGLDGPGLWREARARLPGRAPPFVFLTGDALRLDRAAEMRDAGCPFVEKPFEPAAIRRVIREVLGAAD